MILSKQRELTLEGQYKPYNEQAWILNKMILNVSKPYNSLDRQYKPRKE